MSEQTRNFHLGVILTVATGVFCSPDGMDGIYDLCNWMTGDDLLTHQLPRASEECEAEIYRQHPDLREIGKPAFNGEAEGRAWLAAMTTKYGEFRDIAPLAAADHTVIDPIAEAKMMNANITVIDL